LRPVGVDAAAGKTQGTQVYQTALHNKRNEDQFNRSSPSSPRATRANGHLYKNPSTDLSTRGTASLNLSLKPRDSPQTDNKKGHSRRKGQHVFKGRVSLRSTFQSEVEPEESGHAASPRLPSNHIQYSTAVVSFPTWTYPVMGRTGQLP